MYIGLQLVHRIDKVDVQQEHRRFSLSGSDHKVAAFWSDEVGFQCPTWQCGGTRVCNRVTVMTGS